MSVGERVWKGAMTSIRTRHLSDRFYPVVALQTYRATRQQVVRELVQDISQRFPDMDDSGVIRRRLGVPIGLEDSPWD